MDIQPREFLDKLVRSDNTPKTSQPSVGAFLETYNKLGEDGSSIISIQLSEGLSGTYSSAKTASEMTDANVTVINSGFISSALSFQVLEAAKMAQAGATVEEIVARLETVRKNTRMFILVDTLEYLKKGGRLGRGAAFFGSLLKIKPVATLTDGVYTPATKVRTHSQFIKFCEQAFQDDTSNRTVKGIGVAHVAAEELALQLKEKINFSNTVIVETTPVISSHIGPGAVAFMYYFD